MLAELKAEREINRLQAYYGQLCDRGYPPEEIAALFTDAGIWQSSPNGRRLQGSSAIASYFGGADELYPWALHVNVPLGVELSDDGLSARGSWYLLMPCVDNTTGHKTAAWLAGRYDNEYVREEGKWLFSSLHVSYGLMTQHLTDWAANRFALNT
ncbi:nuclear transport factor 2 family protein [Arthrobacter sp. NPDC080073]|uniref:nuclear transport factor 2 family protein n=1 Tax=Arthrobacter sp. NPDC080073 TaxID=3155919 RepID=UPI00341AB818